MTIKRVLLATTLLSLFMASQLAQAHPPGHRGWRGGVGIYMGSPFPFYAPPPMVYSYGYPYPYPYVYSAPPVIVSPPQPEVYIEQGQGATAPTPAPAPPAASADNNQGMWYFCEQSNSYYPYVKECPAGWKPVAPTPPGSAR